MKVVMSQALVPEGMALFKEKGVEIYVADNNNVNNYLDQMQDADAIVLRIATMDRHAIENSPKLKVIGRPGVGFDCADVAAATERGIPCVIATGANSRAVAEHTVGMMFAIAKNYVECDIGTRKGDYTRVRGLGKAFDLQGKNVAVIGLGHIGSQVSMMCKALGMNVMGCDPYLTKEKIESYGAECYANFEDMLPKADILTVHVPLMETTRNMITKKHLECMKKTAIVINNARGGIINEQDLVDALNNDVIAGAGVDVYTEEPPAASFPVFKAKNMIVTPHSAALTRETLVRTATMCAQGILDVLEGKKVPNVFNPEVYEHKIWKNA